MTDDTTTPDTPATGGGEPTVNCLTQYVKDLSFENPNAVRSATEEGSAPDVTMNVQISVAQLHANMYEVTLSVEGKAVRGDKHLFMVEMAYAGLFAIENIPAQHVEPVLYVHCATLLFPFARQIIADVTRNGGYPPLLLNAVDFNQLYHEQMAARQNSGTA
jgi:preprotein translocase subunit SecB